MPAQAPPDPLKLVIRDERRRIAPGSSRWPERYCAKKASRRRSPVMSAAALLAAIRAGRAFDVLLLDVMMDGMALAAALRAWHEDAAIIFISPTAKWRCGLRGGGVALSSPSRWTLKSCGRRFCTAAPPGWGVRARSARRKRPEQRRARRRALRRSVGEGRAAPPRRRDSRSAPAPLAGRRHAPEGQFACCHGTLLVNLAQVRHVR